MLSVSGWVLNYEFRNADDLDAVRGARAARDLLGSDFVTSELPTGSDGFGRQRVGAGFDGRLMGDKHQLGNGHDQQSSGSTQHWTASPDNGQPTNTGNAWSRPTKFGSIVFRSDTSGGSGGIAVVTEAESPGKSSTIIIQNEDGSYTITHPDGTVETGQNNSGSPLPPTEHDPDGDGIPGNGTAGDPPPDAETADAPTGGEEDVPEDTTAGQPAPHDGSTSGGRNAGKWTPFGGYVSPSHTFFDTISQPGTDGQVTVTGSARPNAGPGAVTNGGDGGFVAGGNTGGSGGFGHNPCATVIGCGDGPGGVGPEGTAPDRG